MKNLEKLKTELENELCAIELDIQQKEEHLITQQGSVPHFIREQARAKLAVPVQ